MINILALLISFCISGVSAYFSIIGLTAIFSAAYYPIIIMGAALEIGKLIASSWLYRNWSNCPFLLKTYLTIAVAVLMLITSMGTFGFLSKAHIEQNLEITTGSADEVEVVQTKIDSEQSIIDDLNKQISQIDAAVSKMTDKGQAQSSLQAADKQRKVRDDLTKQKTQHIETLNTLKAQKVKLNSSIKKIEAEVGPVKYIAALIYGSAGSDNLELAVRWVIILLVVVFDPLAVVLLLAANHGLNQRKVFTNIDDYSILNIGSNVFGDVNVTKRQVDKELNDRYDFDVSGEQDLHKEGRDPDTSPDDQRSFVWDRGWRPDSGSDDASRTQQALQNGIRIVDGVGFPEKI